MSMEPLQPDWVSQPWMYHLPQKAHEIISWSREWMAFMLKWCEFENRHLITVSDVLLSNSFRTQDTSLPPEGVQKIFEHLISNNLAKWWGKNNNLLRVYWRSLEQWADIIIKWAISGGGITFDPYQLSKADQNFSTLPKQDLEEILELLVEHKQAEWIDMRRRLVRLRI